jgi:hypothetical protein
MRYLLLFWQEEMIPYLQEAREAIFHRRKEKEKKHETDNNKIIDYEMRRVARYLLDVFLFHL